MSGPTRGMTETWDDQRIWITWAKLLLVLCYKSHAKTRRVAAAYISALYAADFGPQTIVSKPGNKQIN